MPPPPLPLRAATFTSLSVTPLKDEIDQCLQSLYHNPEFLDPILTKHRNSLLAPFASTCLLEQDISVIIAALKTLEEANEFVERVQALLRKIQQDSPVNSETSETFEDAQANQVTDEVTQTPIKEHKANDDSITQEANANEPVAKPNKSTKADISSAVFIDIKNVLVKPLKVWTEKQIMAFRLAVDQTVAKDDWTPTSNVLLFSSSILDLLTFVHSLYTFVFKIPSEAIATSLLEDTLQTITSAVFDGVYRYNELCEAASRNLLLSMMYEPPEVSRLVAAKEPISAVIKLIRKKSNMSVTPAQTNTEVQPKEEKHEDVDVSNNICCIICNIAHAINEIDSLDQIITTKALERGCNAVARNTVTATLLRAVPLLQQSIPRMIGSLVKAMVQSLFTPLSKTLYRGVPSKESSKVPNSSPFASANRPPPFETIAPDYIQAFVDESQMYMDHLPGKVAVDVMRGFFAELVKEWEDLILGKSTKLDKNSVQWGEDDWEWIVGDMEALQDALVKHVRIRPSPGESPQPRPLALSRHSADDITHRLLSFLKQYAPEPTSELERIMQTNPDPNLKRLICRRKDVPVNLFISNQKGLMGKMQAIGRKGTEAMNKKIGIV